MKIWNFGIIGTGMIADFHAQAIQSMGNARLVGVCGSDSAKADIFAQKFNCKAFSNYSEMLRSDEIDIVTIATPSGNHMDPTVEAAQQGKHVLCEKPMEISLDRIDAMISAHRNSGTYLGGIFNYRYSDSVALLKRAVDEGRFGNLSFVSVHVPWWRSDEYYQSKWRGTWKLDGGGALMNQSIHMIDLMQYLVGPLSSLQASIATIGHAIEVEDTAAAIVKFKNNALGSIYGSTASFPGQFRRMEITGTKGTAILIDDAIAVWQFADQKEEDFEILNNIGGPSGGGGASDPASISYLFHKKNIAAFIAAIESGKPFEINGDEARKAVEIVLAIYTSAKEGRPYLFS
jgi:predicted dehydrogenase